MPRPKKEAEQPEVTEEDKIKELEAKLAALEAQNAEIEAKIPKPSNTSRVVRWDIDPHTTKDKMAMSHEVYLKEGFTFKDGTTIKKFRNHDAVMKALEESVDTEA